MIDDTPEIRVARAADPVWREEMARRSKAASEKFARRREEVGLPLKQSPNMRVCG